MLTLFEKMLRSAPLEGSPAANSPIPETAPPSSPDSQTPAPEGVGSILGQEPAKAEGEAEPAKVEEAKPTFDIKELALPENFTIPEETGAKLQETVTKYGLPKEAVQDLVGMYAAELQKVQSEAYSTYEKLNNEWVDSIKSDKEVGGEKFDANLGKIGAFLSNPAFVDPGFKAALNLTGAGNHPAVFKTMLKIAEALSEGGPVSGAPTASPKPATVAEAMYPNLPKGY